MEKIKRFITCHIPTYSCNFRCSYCYIATHENAYFGRNKQFSLSPKEIAYRLSPEKIGGICYFNMCACGETMLQKDMFPLMKEIIKEGHYCDIITNLSLSQKVKEFIDTFTEDERKRVFVKCSFHYLQLKEKNLLDTFVQNVNLLKAAKISYTIEITPHDELIPFIDEIKDFSMKNLGALPHITVARNEATEKIEILTKYSREEYQKIWSVFDSKLFDFKFSIFNRQIKEFCYAGQNSVYINLANGDCRQCYCGDIIGNIYEKNYTLKFRPVGKCRLPHCYNGHAFIALGGAVPDLPIEMPTYEEERNRLASDGTEWLQPETKEFFSSRADCSNQILTVDEKKKILFKNEILRPFNYSKEFQRRVIRKIKSIINHPKNNL